MKFFADTAIIDEIKGLNGFGLLDGVTITALLIAKSGRDFNEVITEILPSLTGWIKGPFPKLSVTDSNFKLNANALFADTEFLEPSVTLGRLTEIDA